MTYPSLCVAPMIIRRRRPAKPLVSNTPGRGGADLKLAGVERKELRFLSDGDPGT